MTKEELHATNQRLAAEVAAWREFATVISGAGLARPPADEESIDYLRQCSYRLENVTHLTAALMKYTGESYFPAIVLNTTETLRGIIATLKRYQAAEPAPAVCGARNPGAGHALCTREPGHPGGHKHAQTGEYWPAAQAVSVAS